MFVFLIPSRFGGCWNLLPWELPAAKDPNKATMLKQLELDRRHLVLLGVVQQKCSSMCLMAMGHI